MNRTQNDKHKLTDQVLDELENLANVKSDSPLAYKQPKANLLEGLCEASEEDANRRHTKLHDPIENLTDLENVSVSPVIPNLSIDQGLLDATKEGLQFQKRNQDDKEAIQKEQNRDKFIIDLLQMLGKRTKSSANLLEEDTYTPVMTNAEKLNSLILDIGTKLNDKTLSSNDKDFFKRLMRYIGNPTKYSKGGDSIEDFRSILKCKESNGLSMDEFFSDASVMRKLQMYVDQVRD